MLEAVKQDLIKRHKAEVERIEAHNAKVAHIIELIGEGTLKMYWAELERIKQLQAKV